MRTVVGLFQDRNEARRTIDDLKRIGVKESDVSLVSNEGANGPMASYLDPSTISQNPQGILNALVRMGLSDTEARRYVDGIQQGCTLETVAVEDARANDALEIMRAHAVGTGARGQGVPGAQGAQGAQRDLRGTGTGTGNIGNIGNRGEEVLPVIVEEIAVGKREVAAGGVRATSTVQETPVQEDVSLRTEKVDVERRAVDRPVQPGDTDIFRDREIEVTATAEEAVVAKSARVVEEVVVTKDVDTRTETIRDTVRRTDVNVERIPYEASNYQGHYDTEYGNKSGSSFKDYEPAYRFGHEMRGTSSGEGAGGMGMGMGTDADAGATASPGQMDTEGGGDWSSVEPSARSNWEKGNPNTWDRFKGAIRHAFERAKG